MRRLSTPVVDRETARDLSVTGGADGKHYGAGTSTIVVTATGKVGVAVA